MRERESASFAYFRKEVGDASIRSVETACARTQYDELKEGAPMKKFVIREVETVKTTAAFYECRVCFPEWLCAILEGTAN